MKKHQISGSISGESETDLDMLVYLYLEFSISPGLSATNRMATHPPGGVPMVFLCGGSMKLNLAVSVLGLKLPKPDPIT